MEELVYLHEVWPQVREWEAVKNMRLEWFFFESMKHITFNFYFVSFSLTLKLHLKDVCDCDSRLLFLGPLFLSLYVHIHIYI